MGDSALLFRWRAAFCSEQGPPNPTTRFVLLVLSLNMRVDGTRGFPSQETIAEKSGLNERTVRDHIQLAVKLGWLGRAPRRSGARSYHSGTLYAPRFPIPERASGSIPESASGMKTSIRNLAPVIPESDDTSIRNQVPVNTSVNSPRTHQTSALSPNGLTAGDGVGVVMIPLNDGTEYGVSQAEVDELGNLYPALDVIQTLHEIRGWNLSHAERRKTRRGVMAHVHGWFAKEQNRAP